MGKAVEKIMKIVTLLPKLLLLLALATSPFSYAGSGCRPWLDRYLAEWNKIHPEKETRILSSTSTASDRLAQFREGVGGEVVPMGEGAEGKVYTSPLTPDRALKVWKTKRVAEMTEGVNYLVAVSKDIKAIPELSSKIKVVEVYERGPDWIVREFYPDSRPLQEVFQTDPVARAAVNDIRRFLNAGDKANPAIENLRKMITKNTISPNLHWDAYSQKVVMIDGF